MAKPNIFSIIPKPKEQESNVIVIAFWLGICLLAATAGAYFILRGQASALAQKKAAVEQERGALIAQNSDLTHKMIGLSRSISDYLAIFKNHRLNSNLYEFLGGICHRRAQFTSLNIAETSNHISLGVKTESFKTLGEQLLILKEHPLIKETKFSGLNMGKDGKVTCVIDFDFDEKIITPFKDL